ncbi:MAG TPA: hypothetical protein VFI73_07730 [Candidatus Nitrosopolaris sp.]|nr:hypothetical protein [Candidatus Nitrosopolaris sp.]
MLEAKKAFGLFFIAIAVAVVVGTLLTEIASKYNVPIYYIALIWPASFGVAFGANFRKFRRVIVSVRTRMRNSMKWPSRAKAINGLCWASPFALIGVFPSMYQYLILVGIGLGNLSTYLLMKKYNGLNNREQMIVGLISLASVPISIRIDMTLFVLNHDIAVFLSRILIGLAYAIGGVYALLNKE